MEQDASIRSASRVENFPIKTERSQESGRSLEKDENMFLLTPIFVAALISKYSPTQILYTSGIRLTNCFEDIDSRMGGLELGVQETQPLGDDFRRGHVGFGG